MNIVSHIYHVYNIDVDIIQKWGILVVAYILMAMVNTCSKHICYIHQTNFMNFIYGVLCTIFPTIN